VKAELGRKVLDHVTAHRDQFNMLIWAEPATPDCGTAACLGGWTLLLSGYGLLGPNDFTRPDGTALLPECIGSEAASVLGLTDDEHYGPPGVNSTLFGETDPERAIARFRVIVERAEQSRAGRAAAA
jgi:hypothetical protein